MKKTLMTFVAVGFGVSVAFAQTAPAETNQQDIQTQTEQTATINQDEQDRRKVELSELPQEAQDAFKNGQYSDLQVLAVYEIKPESAEEATVYEFELAQAQAEEATDTGTTNDGLAGVETEQVSERQPDIILQIDENGEIKKEENLDEEK
jgi:hypothetical protein